MSVLLPESHSANVQVGLMGRPAGWPAAKEEAEGASLKPRNEFLPRELGMDDLFDFYARGNACFVSSEKRNEPNGKMKPTPIIRPHVYVERSF